jgi:hypothetical protein
MQLRKILIAVLALAIAIAFSPLEALQAAVLSAGSAPQADTLIQTVKAKKHAKHKMKRRHHHRRGKRARSKGPGKCGTFMYWSGKKHRCMDKR